jgi:hypothetical protein
MRGRLTYINSKRTSRNQSDKLAVTPMTRLGLGIYRPDNKIHDFLDRRLLLV